MHKFIIIVFLCGSHFLMMGQHSLIKLSYPVNTDTYNEICPVVSYDKSKLFFTRVADPECEKTLVIDSVDVFKKLNENEYLLKLKQVFRQLASTIIPDPFASHYNQDIWYTTLNNELTLDVFHPGYPINDVLPNSICSNFGKGNSFLIINQFDPYGGIEKGFSMTNMIDDQFSFPNPIHIKDFHKISTEVNITSTIDSAFLILSMENNDSIKNMDLYLSRKLDHLNYSTPQKLEDNINTSFRESTPMISHDGKKLYFTSDRPGGYGGKDIYFSERLDETFLHWSAPEKLNPPVNSEYNDPHPHVLNDQNTIFFTSTRDGSSDIFKAKLVREKLDQILLVHIKIILSKTNQEFPAELYWGEAYKDEMFGYFRSRDGNYTYTFTENKPMVFKAVNRNLQSEVVISDPQDMINRGISESYITLILNDFNIDNTSMAQVSSSNEADNSDELELNKSVLLNNIYFERTKAVVLPESFPAISKLADILLTRSKLFIKIIGHTDNIGDKTALKKLSKDRAQAIKDLLVNKGVSSSRIEIAGYGDIFPLGPNDTEENKSKNRRVEIKVISNQ